jgi:hypothetical protein
MTPDGDPTLTGTNIRLLLPESPYYGRPSSSPGKLLKIVAVAANVQEMHVEVLPRDPE